MESTEEIVDSVFPKAKGKPGRKPKQVEGVDLAALVAQLGEQQKETLIELAAQLRKPTELEQRKLDQERDSIRKRAEMSVAAAKQHDLQQGAKQSRCPHADKNGITTFVSQVYGDGFWKPFCARCQLQLPAIKATHEEEMGGINLRTWENVTEAGLRQLAQIRGLKAA